MESKETYRGETFPVRESLYTEALTPEQLGSGHFPVYRRSGTMSFVGGNARSTFSS